MKFVTRDSHLKQLLLDWAGESPLIYGSLYFWVAGIPLQRSLIGLHRTLLVQMLKAEESLCRVAFPD